VELFKILGLILILIGIVIFFAPEIARLLAAYKESPLIFIGIRRGKFWIGTSPILIAILLATYIILTKLTK